MTQESEQPEEMSKWEVVAVCYAYVLIYFMIIVLVWGLFLLTGGKDVMTWDVTLSAFAYMYPFLLIFFMTSKPKSENTHLRIFRFVGSSYACGYIIAMNMANNEKTPELIWQTLSNFLFR